jgi:hypothetical protein
MITDRFDRIATETTHDHGVGEGLGGLESAKGWEWVRPLGGVAAEPGLADEGLADLAGVNRG